MADHVKVDPSKKQIETAQTGWAAFTKAGTWSIIITCVVMALLGIVFIDW